MGILGAFGSLTRDFIQYILPTIIGMAIFAPFFVPKGYNLSVDIAILLCFILGYVIYMPMYDLATWVHDRLPIRSLNLKPIKELRKWWARNWDYDVLWVRLDKDEREYLYMTAAYIVFSQITALYFLIYSILNAALLIWTITVGKGPATMPIYQRLLAIRTPLLGGWSLPTLLVLPIALILARYLYLNVIQEYEIMYGEKGFLIQFAGKYHQDSGRIAQSIWGSVVGENQVDNQDSVKKQPLADIRVHLVGPDGCHLATANTNQSGYFQMEGVYQRCLGMRCNLQVDDDIWEGILEMTPTEKGIPTFEVPARLKAIPTNPQSLPSISV